MKVLIVFRAMFGLLVHMLLMVEAQATCQTNYNGVLFPCDVIQRWRHRRENYYKLERAFIIKRGHPSEHYSSLKLFWPEDAAPYFNRDRITFYKCINRTPTIAKTLMHIIRGGMGTPELVVDVMYTPVKYRLMNRVVITCHIYTARDESVVNRQEEPWNQFDIESYNDQIKPVGGQSTLANCTLGTTAVSLGTTNFTRTTATVALQSTTQATTTFRATTPKATTLKATTPKATTLKATTLKATTKKTQQPTEGGNELDLTDKETTKQIDGHRKNSENYVTTPRTDGEEPRSKETTEEIKKTTLIEATTNKTSKKLLPGEVFRHRITNVSSYTTKTTMKTSGERWSEARDMKSVTTLGVTASSKTVEVTSEKGVTSLKIDNTTPKIEANCSKPDETLCGGTNTGTNETTSTNKYSQGEIMNEINSSLTKTSPKPKATTVEVTSQKSKSTLVTNTVREVRIILCGEVNLPPNGAKDSKKDKTNKISSNEVTTTSTKSVELTTKRIVTQKLDGENLVFMEGRRNSKPDDTSRNPSTSALYNLVAKTAKKKFGLAKISYQ